MSFPAEPQAAVRRAFSINTTKGEYIVEGMQKTVSERLKGMEQRVRDGTYGVCDELDVDAVREDIEDITADM